MKQKALLAAIAISCLPALSMAVNIVGTWKSSPNDAEIMNRNISLTFYKNGKMSFIGNHKKGTGVYKVVGNKFIIDTSGAKRGPGTHAEGIIDPAGKFLKMESGIRRNNQPVMLVLYRQ